MLCFKEPTTQCSALDQIDTMLLQPLRATAFGDFTDMPTSSRNILSDQDDIDSPSPTGMIAMDRSITLMHGSFGPTLPTLFTTVLASKTVVASIPSSRTLPTPSPSTPAMTSRVSDVSAPSTTDPIDMPSLIMHVVNVVRPIGNRTPVVPPTPTPTSVPTRHSIALCPDTDVNASLCRLRLPHCQVRPYLLALPLAKPVLHLRSAMILLNSLPPPYPIQRYSFAHQNFLRFGSMTTSYQRL